MYHTFERLATSPFPSISSARKRPAALALVLLLLLPFLAAPAAAQSSESEALANQVEIRRTDYGVPHILGENLRAAAFGLGYTQAEDYGEDVIRTLLSARGERARYLGREYLGSDFRNRQRHARAVETYHRLDPDVRDVLEGFAEGVNHYIRTYQDELPEWAAPIFTGHDVAARDVGWASTGSVSDFVEQLQEEEDTRIAPEVYPVPDEAIEEPVEETADSPGAHPDAGSNTWALAPSRTTSGNAILMRNPHLSWSAGYYEAHFKVPGKINFYGDFRVGGPFTTVGGFNEYLGFSTTNNAPRTHEIYALELDPERPDHYRFDGASVPIRREEVSVEFKSGDGLGVETREFLYTPLGPVVHRSEGWIYILRDARHGRYRLGEQFLGMMMATSYEEWEAAMRIRTRPRSNFAYADRDGNIHYIWSGVPPQLPHAAGGDTLAIPARRSSEIWTSLIPYGDLPQLLNPEGGYVRNENDPFHFTNLHEPLAEEDFPDEFPEASLRLRSLHSLELLHNDRRFSLEDVVEAKHSMRMLLADRVKDDLLAAVLQANPTGDVAAAAELLAEWDNTVAAESRGGVLFKTWWDLYREAVDSDVYPREQDPALFREPWTPETPFTTPQGLADAEAAALTFEQAVRETEQQWGDWDVAWGEVHRARRGELDLPVGGCTGSLGCFRTLWFTEDDDDGKLRIRGGDGWVFAVEFGETPRAYSVLAYGQSNQEDHPHYDDQLELFVRNEMKPVRFTEEGIQAGLLRSYRPGEERAVEVAN